MKSQPTQNFQKFLWWNQSYSAKPQLHSKYSQTVVDFSLQYFLFAELCLKQGRVAKSELNCVGKVNVVLSSNTHWKSFYLQYNKNRVPRNNVDQLEQSST